MSRRPGLAQGVVGAAIAGILAACSGGSGDDLSDGTRATAPPTTAPIPAVSEPGAGTVVVGGTASSFEVTSCTVEPDPEAPEGARILFAATGEGTSASGVEFSVEAQRFVTGIGTQTFTDTILYSDAGRILQAQRIEVAGQVTDLRDERAASPLLRLRADGASASGLASAPGDVAADQGLIPLALDLTCPGSSASAT